MKNRILCLLLAMIMVVSLLCSCGGNGDKNPSDDDDDTPGITDDNDDTVSYPWTNEDLIFQMNMNTNGDQLSSMCKRYLAGEEGIITDVDKKVVLRNGAAYAATKVSVTYEYWTAADGADWGGSTSKIINLTKSGDSSAPDMYCSFVYDMVAALLQGAFANIASDVRGTNYLRVVADDYNPEVDDEGYMYEYMTSMTLSEKNVYLIASDYFIDTIRAFFVVPVNIALLEGDAAKAVTKEIAGGGDGSYDAFIGDVVKAKKWDYNNLIKYCEAVGQENPTSNQFDLKGGTVGWALASDSGLSSSGMIYTSTVKIIERDGTDLSNYTYRYPTANEDLITLSENIKNLMSTHGAVIADYKSINDAFTKGGRVLFGGVINVGKIEDPEYQNMMGNGGAGVGVVPVPLYRSNTFDLPETHPDYVMDSYQTQIHNNGRIGAIAANTTQFSACTAFLNYQSTHSTDILNEYYEWNLAKGSAGNNTGNVEMLNYIRANVRSAFDKVFEDAISIYNKDLTAWHKAVQDGKYSSTNTPSENSLGKYMLGGEMRTAYLALYQAKQAALNSLRDSFEQAGGFNADN